MSASYDNKVVEMRFDGKQFEAGVESSYSAIQKLKSALNFSDSAKGFDELEHASKGVKLSGIMSAANAASQSFSALEIVAITALANITNKAVDAGIKMAKSLTLDQVSAGFDQFSRKTTAVSTMMISTGKTIDEVADVMDKVTWFADETSYSFGEMTDSIAKFVSNGVGLEDSATAVQGIATWAAKAGQNSQTASRAMYNLSQAIGIGAVTAADWKSIELANMATEDFKKTAIETAQELAKQDKTYAQVFNKAGVSVNNFKDTLQTKWFTNDVLIKTLSKYGEYADYLYEHSDDYDTATAAMKALGSAGMDFGMEAFQAAQKARTLEDVVNSLKDASKSQWAGLFENIFGNSEYATDTFTSLANDAWEVFVGPLSNMKDLVGEVMQPDATKQFGYAVKEAGFDISEFKTQLEIVGKESGKLNASMIAQAGSLERTLESNWMDAEIYADALERSVMKGAGSLDAYISEVSKTWNDYQKNQYKRWTETEGRDIEDLGHTGTGPEQYNDDWMYRQLGLDKERIKNATKLTDAQKKYIESVRDGTEEVMRYNEAEAKQLSGQDKMRSIMLDTVGIMKSVSGIFSNAWSKIFPKENIINGFTSALDTAYKSVHGIFVALRNETDGNNAYNAFGLYTLLSNSFEFVANSADLAATAVKGLFAALRSVFGGNFIAASFKVIGEGIGIVSDIIAALTSSIKEAFGDMRDLMPFTLDVIPSKILDITKAFRTWLKEGGRLKRMTDKFVNGFKNAGAAVKNFLADFIDIDRLTATWNKFAAAFNDRFGDLTGFFREFGNTINRVISRIRELTKELTFDNLKAALKIIGEEFADFFSFIPFEDLEELFSGIVDKISDFGERAGEEISKVIDKFSDIYDRAKELSSKVYKVFTEGFEKGYTNGILSIIVGVASGTAALTLIQKLSSALTTLATPVDMFGQILTNINGVLSTLKTDLKAMKFDIYANGFMKIAFAMVALAAAMWILKDLDTGFLIGVATALGIFMGLAIWLVAQAAKIDAIKLSALGSAFSALAVTFLSMAGTMWILSKVDWNELGKGVGYIIGALAIIAGALTAAAFVPEAAVVKMDATAGAIAAFAFSFVEIGAALWILSKMKIDDVEESMKKMESVILAMVGMAIAVRLAGPGAADGAKSISELGKSMLILAAGLFLLSKINDHDIARGTAIMALMEVLMIGMAGIARLASGENVDKAGRGMMSMATTFIIMAAAMAIVGNLSPSEIAKGTAGLIAMSAAMILIGAAIKIATSSGAITGATVASFLAMSVAIAILAASLIAIANLAKDMNSLAIAAEALAGIFAVIGIVLGISSVVTVKGIAGLVVSIVAVAAIAAALAYLANSCDPSALQTAALAIGGILLAVGVMTGIIVLAGAFSNAVTLITGLGAILAALIALVAIVVVMTVIAEDLSKIQDVKQKFELLADVFEYIGQAFGGLIGGALFKILDDVGRGLQKISDVFSNMKDVGGKDASETMLNISEALLGFAKLKPSKIDADGIKKTLNDLSDTVSNFFGKLNATSISTYKVGQYIDAISKLFDTVSKLPRGNAFSGDIDTKKISGMLTALGTGLMNFVNSTKGLEIDHDALDKNLGHIQTMADVLDSMPKFGGINQKLEGETIDSTKIGTYMTALKNALVEINNLFTDEATKSIKDNSGAIADLVSIMGDMATAMDALPETASRLNLKLFGLSVSWNSGKTDVQGFKNFVSELGPALTSINELCATTESSSSLDVEAIKTAADCVTVLANSMKAIDETGGMVGFFTGELDGDKFKTDLENVGNGLNGFKTALGADKYDPKTVENVNKYANALKTLGATLRDYVATADGTNIGSEMSMSLVSMTTGLDAFANSYGAKNSATMAKRVDNISEMVNTMKDISTKASSLEMVKVSTALTSLGNSLDRFDDMVWDINTDVITEVLTSISDVFTTAADTSGPLDFMSKMSTMLTEGMTELQNNITTMDTAGLQSALDGYILKFQEMILSASEKMQTAFAQMITDAFSGGMSGGSADLTSVGATLGTSLATGIQEADYSKVSEPLLRSLKQQTNKTQARSTGREIGNEFVAGLKGVSAYAAAAAIASSAINGFGSVDATSQGVDLAQGFINGLDSMARSIYNSGVSAGKKAVAGIHDGAGNGSPSELGFQEGSWLDQGFINGIYANVNRIEAASEYAGKAAVDSLSESMNHVASVFTHDFDVQPVIAPVLDLSNVEAGARTINATLSSAKSYDVQSSMNAASDPSVQNGTAAGSINYIQNNYSPKALSRIEIYRQTRNQLASVKG